MRTRKWVSAAAITSALVIAAVGDARADVQGWTIVGSENLPGGLRAGLFASACVSASDCWAVGEQRSATDYSAPLAEHWDGTAWSIATTPKPFATLNATLYALACPSTTSCWATGLLSVTGGGSAPLVEHWDGAAWTISDVPLPSGEQFGGLRGVTCASTTLQKNSVLDFGKISKRGWPASWA